MDLSIVIPWRTDHGPREAAWNYLRPRWEALGHELVVVDDPEPGTWSTARAIRAGVPLTSGDLITVYGADHLPDPDVLDRAVSLLDVHPWCYLYEAVLYATEQSTADLLAGRIGEHQLIWGARSDRCVGMWAFRRTVWDETGGVDPRFVGWGYGDDAFNAVLETVYGPSPARPGQELRELWHPEAERDASAANPNHGLFHTEYAPHVGDRAYMLSMRERWSA